jgi:flagellar protein FliO/FliZ
MKNVSFDTLSSIAGIAFFFTIPVATVSASDSAAAAAPSLLTEVLAVFVPLAFILLALLAVLLLLKRQFRSPKNSTPLSIVQVLSLGPRERIVVIRTLAGRVLTIGVSPHTLRLIAELDIDDIEQEAVDESTDTD